jgi:hypothetical protein
MPRIIHQHPNDRTASHTAAEAFGKLMAQGLLSREEIRAAFPPCSSGEIIRLMWTVDDAATYYRRSVEAAERRIRAAIRPLFASGAEKTAIETTARKAADDSPLPVSSFYAILRDEMLRARRR